jgi:aspartyl-tRNA(Asn)/glutamyl-tRNA(Gln) amidotransferase subunit C
MKIDRKLIEHLESLARIELTEGEREKLAEQLGRIVAFVETLQSVDTSGVEVTRLVTHSDDEHLREDQSATGLDREAVLDQAPDAVDGFFRVPRVIDRDEGA